MQQMRIKKHITTIEYDEISNFAIRYTKGKCKLYFDQNEAKQIAEKNGVKIPKIIFLSDMILTETQCLFMKISREQKTIKPLWKLFRFIF